MFIKSSMIEYAWGQQHMVKNRRKIQTGKSRVLSNQKLLFEVRDTTPHRMPIPIYVGGNLLLHSQHQFIIMMLACIADIRQGLKQYQT
jgi:hypothetical protein